jgi:aspartyl protease family protein
MSTSLPLTLLTLVMCGTTLGAHAQKVSLQGMLGRKALIMVDGSAPKSVAPGETHQGVTVISTAGDQAILEIKGQRHTLRVGESPASVGGTGPQRGSKIVLTADSGGHFLTQGTINGRSTLFMVDTGATVIALGAAQAQSMGINYRSGRPVQFGTANGTVPGWLIKLNSVRIGDVEVYEVDAVVGQQAMPFVLLGNSFLTRFQMRRENDMMVLERRY